MYRSKKGFKTGHKKDYSAPRMPSKQAVVNQHMKMLAAAEARKVFSRQTETKVHRHSEGPTAIPSFGMVLNLHPTLQTGTTAGAVIGKQIRPTSLWMNINFNFGESSTLGDDKYNNIQFHIIQDLRPTTDLGDFAPTDLWFAPNDTGVVSIFNPDMVPSMIKVLHSGIVSLSANGLPTNMQAIKIKDFPSTIDYQGSPDSINPDASGKLWIACISDSAITPHPSVTYDLLLYYKDS